MDPNETIARLGSLLEDMTHDGAGDGNYMASKALEYFQAFSAWRASGGFDATNWDDMTVLKDGTES